MTRRHLSLLFVTGLALGAAPFADAAAQTPAKKPAPAAPAKKSAPSALSANEIAERVQNFYDRTTTFKAGFRQLYVVKVYNKKVESKGSVIFEKPGKMSWRYTNNGNRVVSDGKLIKVYEKQNNQMYEQPLEKSQYPAALAFLVGGGKLTDSFRLTKADPKQMAFEGGFVLVGEPKQPTASYERIFLYVDANTYQVRRVLLLDAQGNRNRFDFLTPEVNRKPPRGEFAFTPPKGTTIIRP